VTISLRFVNTSLQFFYRFSVLLSCIEIFSTGEKGMQKKNAENYLTSTILFLSFIVFTFLVKTVDVRPIGPDNSSVGFASVNECIFNTTGYHFLLYTITDWMGAAAILTAFCFAVLGLCQCIHRQSIKKVDSDILLLGVFYLTVIAVYVFFEKIIINYRPVFMNGRLEPSYPSSHTMIVVCIMGTAMMQFKYRIKNAVFLRIIKTLSASLTGFYYSACSQLISGTGDTPAVPNRNSAK
jgi:membrane-associated phospholipid phosphatase